MLAATPFLTGRTARRGNVGIDPFQGKARRRPRERSGHRPDAWLAPTQFSRMAHEAPTAGPETPSAANIVKPLVGRASAR